MISSAVCIQIRPLVEIHQPSVQFDLARHGARVFLELEWMVRWGGTFGTNSSAEANACRNKNSSEKLFNHLDKQNQHRSADTQPNTDRGQVPAWLLYLKCPQCFRRCRVLYSLHSKFDYGCTKCNRPAWPSNTWSVSGHRSAGPAAKCERMRLKHSQAAERIRQGYLFHTESHTELFQPSADTIPKPLRMTWRRYQALCRLIEAHEYLAIIAQCGHVQSSLHRLNDLSNQSTLVEGVEGNNGTSSAYRILKMDAWALRQRSWHRRGKPRDTPGEGTRARLRKV